LAWLLAGGVAAAGTPVLPVAAPAAAATAPVDWQQHAASAEVQQVAGWVARSADNGGRPYLIVDKVNARVFVFDAVGSLRGADAALLGLARGDGSAAGIGEQNLSAMRRHDRTTPAGRFIASLDHDVHGKEVLLIDYAASIALHAVVKGLPAERRAQRLESATAQDNRISFGCINVPEAFYEKVVSPAFRNTLGVVYILPEMSSAKLLFEPAVAKATRVN
jgi:hypothetical protein